MQKLNTNNLEEMKQRQRFTNEEFEEICKSKAETNLFLVNEELTEDGYVKLKNADQLSAFSREELKRIYMALRNAGIIPFDPEAEKDEYDEDTVVLGIAIMPGYTSTVWAAADDQRNNTGTAELFRMNFEKTADGRERVRKGLRAFSPEETKNIVTTLVNEGIFRNKGIEKDMQEGLKLMGVVITPIKQEAVWANEEYN